MTTFFHDELPSVSSATHDNATGMTKAAMPAEGDVLRFGGMKRLYGHDSAALFAKAHVVVVGIGGVGSWAVEALARSGVGQLTLIDLDDVCVSNINRQLHALDDTIGRPKVQVMAERMRLINPALRLQPIEGFVTPDNIEQRIPADADHVIDAIDSVSAKTALIAWCKRHRLGITVTGGAGGLIDPTRIEQRDLTRSEHDPLLAKVRARLRRDFGYSRNPKRRFGIHCICSSEQRRYPETSGTVCFQKPGTGASARMDCAAGLGAATFVTGTFGFAAAAHALRMLERQALAAK